MNSRQSEDPTVIPAQMGPGLYQRVMDGKWTTLHETLRQVHGANLRRQVTGKLRIRRNSGMAARLILKLASLPAESEAMPTRLTVTVRGQCEVWERDFDGLRVASVQRPDGLLLAEVFGRLAICFRLESQDGGLRFVQERAQVRLGAIHLLIPSIVAPRVSASETPVGDNGFKANVSVRVPVVGLILAYEGLLHLEADL